MLRGVIRSGIIFRLTARAPFARAEWALSAHSACRVRGHVVKGSMHMQETDMREKLIKIIQAYEDLQGRMGDPAVLADQKEYNRLAKEYASQGPLAHKASEYVQAADDLAAAKEMLADADMKEFAQEEIAEIEAKLPALEEDIKFMLIPADPADDKDIIVEIRAAAGGDEAALFAGDLYKMYERFAGAQGWKTETMDVSPSEAGGSRRSSSKSRATRCTRS